MNMRWPIDAPTGHFNGELMLRVQPAYWPFAVLGQREKSLRLHTGGSHLKLPAFGASTAVSMPFTSERTTQIRALIRSRLEQNNVNDWERSFLSNMEAKFAKDGTRTSLSKAQYSKLHKVLGLKRETTTKLSSKNPPTKRSAPSSRPVKAQNPITAARRTLNAPRRALRRAERHLIVPTIIVIAVIALIGALSGPSDNRNPFSRETATSENVSRASYAYVTGSRVNQRQGPSTSHAVIGSLAEGERVEVLSQEASWTQVRSNLGDGWMASRFLSSQRLTHAATVTPRGSIQPRAVRVIDGDTVEYGGLSIRLVGFDTPETYYAKCAAEKARGDAATKRLRQLISNAGSLQLFLRDERDRYGRGLGSLLVNGIDVGDVLISEGLARRYNGGQRRGWC